MQISSVLCLDHICYDFNWERFPFISNNFFLFWEDLFMLFYRSHSSFTSFPPMWRAFLNSIFSHAEHNLPSALCIFSHSDGILGECSKGFMATFPILPKIPAWYHIPLLPVHKIDLDREGKNLQRVLTTETMAGFVALKIGNRSFPVEMP